MFHPIWYAPQTLGRCHPRGWTWIPMMLPWLLVPHSCSSVLCVVAHREVQRMVTRRPNLPWGPSITRSWSCSLGNSFWWEPRLILDCHRGFFMVFWDHVPRIWQQGHFVCYGFLQWCSFSPTSSAMCQWSSCCNHCWLHNHLNRLQAFGLFVLGWLRCPETSQCLEVLQISLLLTLQRVRERRVLSQPVTASSHWFQPWWLPVLEFCCCHPLGRAGDGFLDLLYWLCCYCWCFVRPLQPGSAAMPFRRWAVLPVHFVVFRERALAWCCSLSLHQHNFLVLMKVPGWQQIQWGPTTQENLEL